ncbi:MAG: hypothetical protein NTU44_16035 [Bacteroidetes bacterium]|nr:hypothetical protein [Bacteroidota bacterium]
MAHEPSLENLSPEELKFREMVQRGDDYHRIELYRWALHYYRLASETPFANKEVEEKIEMISRKIRRETQAIVAVLVIAAVFVALIWIFT